MKTTIAKVSAALLIVAAATSANAQTYGEISYSSVNYEEPAADADLGLLGVTFGYEINKNLAIEGTFAAGVQDDNVQVGAVNVNVDAKHSYGVYLKPKAALGENFEVFAKLGWAKSKLEASGGGLTISDSGSDFAYGIGAQYNFSPKTYVSGGYTNLYDKDSVSVDGWNISIGYRF